MRLRSDLDFLSEEDFSRRLNEERFRDRQLGATRRGPHRDDFQFLLDQRDAKTFSSEGQQRGLVLGLRFSEFEFLKKTRKRTPLLLIDDVLGELDESRKANFKKLLPKDTQVFATGTTFPTSSEGNQWESFEVKSGVFLKS